MRGKRAHQRTSKLYHDQGVRQDMSPTEAVLDHDAQGATVVITHRIKQGGAQAYEDWLNEIGPICRAFPGQLDWQIIRPIAGLSGTYTVVIRFDTQEHLRTWMFSKERERLVEKARPLFVDEDRFHIRTGLDVWFAPAGSVGAPLRWKQAVATLIALYPLVLGIPLLVAPALRALGLPQNHYVDTLVITAIIVWLMAYAVMPYFTRLIKRWLFQ